MFTLKLLACAILAGGTLLAPTAQPGAAAPGATQQLAQQLTQVQTQVQRSDVNSMWEMWPR